MQIQSIGHLSGARLTARPNLDIRSTEKTKHTRQQSMYPAELLTRADEPVPSSATDTVEPTGQDPSVRDDDAKVPGVIRLLEAGHFRGVADVRLRINFFEQLAARAQAAAKPVVEEQSLQLIDTVNTTVDELVAPIASNDETRAAITGLVEAFETSVQEAAEGASAGGTLDAAAIETSIAAAFDTMVDQMRQLLTLPGEEPLPPDDSDASGAQGVSTNTVRIDLEANRPLTRLAATAAEDVRLEVATLDDQPDDTAPVPENPADGAVDHPVEGPVAAVEEALAMLRDAFNEALSSLLATIDSAVRLPDPTPPTGNGVAYDKFMATYNELRGSATVDELG